VGDVVLADTVGFISNLPHSLVESFKSTLEEVASADLLLHVVDVSSEDVDGRIREVESVLREIGADAVPSIMVLNKIDALELNPGQDALNSGVCVSARTGQGLPELIEAIGIRLGVAAPTEVLLGPGEGKTRAWLYGIGAVLEEHIHEDGSLALTVKADEELLARLERRTRA
jgi:GTPase